MPDVSANPAPATSTKPAVPVTKLAVAPPPYAPIAIRIPVKTREGMLKRVAELQPEGNPNPVLLEVAKNTATALINSFGPEVTGVEVLLESNSANARQINVIVFPHEL